MDSDADGNMKRQPGTVRMEMVIRLGQRRQLIFGRNFPNMVFSSAIIGFWVFQLGEWRTANSRDSFT